MSRGPNMKWSGNEIIEFLNIYREYPSLWDITSGTHQNRNAKKAAFNELMTRLEEVGLYADEDQLKKKIKSIRDTYRNELHKINKSIKSGAETEELYRPKLMWYTTADEFLHAVVSSNLNDSLKKTSNEEATIVLNDVKSLVDKPRVESFAVIWRLTQVKLSEKLS